MSCRHDAIDRFLSDAARWVRPEEVADRSELTWPLVARLLYQHPSLRAMAWFRLASWAHERHVRVVPSAIERRIQRLYGLEMVAGADIGGGLYIAHPVGCTIVVESMGANVSVMASVTTGRLEERRWPRIGDRVFIGAGARILGPISVGADAIVGANAVVVHDVPVAATVVGIPARVASSEKPMPEGHE